MIQYPLNFDASLTSPAGIQSAWSAHVGTLSLSCNIPKEFDGPGGGVSPEDLYVLALTNCLVATFKVYAEHSKVTFEECSVTGHLTVDLNDNKKPVMKKCLLKAQLKNANNPVLGKRLLQRALESGFILNSVKTELHLEIEILDTNG